MMKVIKIYKVVWILFFFQWVSLSSPPLLHVAVFQDFHHNKDHCTYLHVDFTIGGETRFTTKSKANNCFIKQLYKYKKHFDSQIAFYF